MSKKILAISSSPRRNGNSETLCDRFIQGAVESGNEVEKVRLCDLNIGFCNGCETCSRTGKCIKNDDVPEIVGKMIASDIIVLATPVYFYTMDAQIKAVIDRSVMAYTKLDGKGFYLFATAAESDPALLDRTIDGLQGFLDCLPGSSVKGVIKAAGVWKKGEIEGTPFLDEAYRMGRSA